MSNSNQKILAPLRFSPLPKEKVWGGHKLAQFCEQDLPSDRAIGEMWCVWDHLSPANDAWAGKTLAEWVREDPLPLLGSRLAEAGHVDFPLLIKLIDAQQTLSVQVHPDDGYAQEHEGEPFGKAEVWYILSVEPGARLIRGLKEPLDRAAVQEAIDDGVLQDWLDYVPVAPGDVIYNPPGTIHALGEGILLYELQQSSDITYRLYDWDRQDPNRPLHIEKSLDVSHLEPYPKQKIQPIEVRKDSTVRIYLCACKHFAAELLRVEDTTFERPAGECFHVLTVLSGSGTVRYPAAPLAGVSLRPGNSLLIPAGIPVYTIQAVEPLTLIKAYVPHLETDIVQPLQAAGISEPRILQLGGASGPSDLAPYLP